MSAGDVSSAELQGEDSEFDCLGPWHLYTPSDGCDAQCDDGSYRGFAPLHMCNSIIFSVTAATFE